MHFVVITLICSGCGSRRKKCCVESKNVKERQLCGPKGDVLLPPEKSTGTDSYCMSEYKK